MKLEVNLKDFIISNYDQIYLMAYWFKLDREDVKYCLEDTSNTVSNPLRTDDNPSLGFMWTKEKLVAKDWADGLYTGDIFHIVGVCIERDCNAGNNFITICNTVIITNERNIIRAKTNKVYKSRKSKAIKFENKPFSINDIRWWNKGGVVTNHLHIRFTFAARSIYIDDSKVYDYNANNPAYVYNLGGTSIKCYTPNNDVKKYKFITNDRSTLEAPHELYPARVLIITKSRKDKYVIECNLENELDKQTIHEALVNKQEHDYCITSFMNESQRLTKDVADYLKTMYDIIIVNTDFDREGIYNAFFHYVSYGFIPVFVGANSSNNDILNSKYTNVLFKQIMVNINTTLHTGMLLEFINKYMNDISEKDWFDYFNVHGIVKGKELVNSKFNIDNFNYE